MDIATVREFERQLIPLRMTAQIDESWVAYAKDTLPEPTLENLKPQLLIAQGYEAGWRAAMTEVARVLGGMQNTALRAPKEDTIWCRLRGKDVSVAECVASCPAPEQLPVCAMEFRP